MFDLSERTSGVLLHLTSLPGPHGNGDLGPAAREFADALASAGQRWWQMLPVGPAGFGNSPYSAHSSFAGNPLLISLEDLVERGLLPRRALTAPPRFPAGRVDYAQSSATRAGRLRAAFEAFRPSPRFRRFCERERGWLEDFALFSAIKDFHGRVEWTRWGPDLRARKPAALARARRALRREIELHRFEQWLFDDQWRAFKAHCNGRGVGLIGDVPIFVAHDSADVWANRELFHLGADGMPSVVAGVPPDYFSASGQRWGNPLYRWATVRKRGYRFWVDRLGLTLRRFDAVRLDHFIGFTRYWEIPSTEPTAKKGRWLPGPKAALFEAVRKAHGSLPLIAEDLGLVTAEVKALRDQLGLPGLKILQFAFGNDPQAPDFLPHNYPRRCVAYTGTHDNDTTVGWFHDRGGQASTRSFEQTEIERKAALAYLGTEGREIHWEVIRALLASVANVAIVPMQDLLGLGSEARMNHPGTLEGNWEWRMREGAFGPRIAERLLSLTRIYGRIPRSP